MTITGQVIAVKEVELDEDDSERAREDYASVREEVNILRALDHQYIVKYVKETERNNPNFHSY